MSPRAAESLRLWEEQEWPTITAWLKEIDTPRKTLLCWKRGSEEFKRRFELRRRAMLAKGQLKPPSTLTALQAKAEKLERVRRAADAIETFFTAYGETGSRIDAAQAAGLDWEDEIEPLFKKEEKLAERYGKLRRYEEMRIADAIRAKATTGDTAAMNALIRQGLLQTPREDGDARVGKGGKGITVGAPDRELQRHYFLRLSTLGSPIPAEYLAGEPESPPDEEEEEPAEEAN